MVQRGFNQDVLSFVWVIIYINVIVKSRLHRSLNLAL